MKSTIVLNGVLLPHTLTHAHIIVRVSRINSNICM